MPQFDFGVIQTATTTGGDLATILENWRDAVLSNHSGTTRPTYVKQGQIWVQMSSGTNWIINLFDGVNDIPLGTVNPANDTTSFSGRSIIQTNSGSAAVTLSQNGMTLGISSQTGVNIVLNLPAAAATGNGFKLTVQKRDSSTGTITLTCLSQDNINGATTYVLKSQYQDITLISDGGNSWYALGGGLADAGVTTAKLADLAVTTAKLANGAVTGGKIAIGTGVAGGVAVFDGTNWTDAITSTVGPILRSNGTQTAPVWSWSLVRSGPYTPSGATPFTISGFPSWARRIQVIFSGIQTAAAPTSFVVSVGTAAAGYQTTGYNSTTSRFTPTGSNSTSSSGFIISAGTAADAMLGTLTLTRNDTLQWNASYVGRSGTASVLAAGNVTLPGDLDRIAIQTIAATTWSAGTITFMYEA